jgi:hypothetical protein
MDKILNLSAFGEEVRPPHAIGAGIATQKEIQMDQPIAQADKSYKGKVFSKVLQNIAQTKLLHWQSLKYGQHKALDELFNGLVESGDTLAESIMGKHGRPVLNEEDLCLNLMNFKDPENLDLTEFTTSMYLFYSTECKETFSSDSEILNLLDEILSLIDQVKYLLTLK